MTISHTMKDDLCRKLRGVGLTREETLPIVNLIHKQVEAEGPENVVRRLKVLKLAGMKQLAGLEPEFNWISHTASGPKGPWRPVWRKLLSSRYRQRKRAFNALMVYSSLMLKKREGPTAAQERKFLSSVAQGSWWVSNLSEEHRNRYYLEHRFSTHMTVIANKVDVTRSKRGLGDPPDILVYFGQKYGTSTHAVAKTERQLNAFLGQDSGRPFHPFPEVLKTLGVTGEDYFELVHPYHNAYGKWYEQQPPDEPVGVVGSTQEPGLKFRAFASPNLILQAALEPLKKVLLATLETMPADCTYNQSEGVTQVQQWLRDGRTIHSIDLSDATNNFPLAFQMEFLRRTCLPASTLRLFELVSTSPYKLMWDKDRHVTWSKGQPLGSGPSFAAFALAHHIVARTAAGNVGLLKAHEHYRILGDDFVTSSADLAGEYTRLLRSLECPISHEKTLVSSVAAEFAGKFITASHVYHGFKYREISDTSFLDVVRTLGRQSVSDVFLSKNQLASAKALLEVPEPWGLGFNPMGKPFSHRYEVYLRLKETLGVKSSDPPVLSVHQARLAFSVQARSPQYWAVHHHGSHWREPEPEIGPVILTARQVVPSLMGIADSDLVSTIDGGDPRPSSVFARAKVVERAYETAVRMSTPFGSTECVADSSADGLIYIGPPLMFDGHSLSGCDVTPDEQSHDSDPSPW